jgi:proteasome accessory factor B
VDKLERLLDLLVTLLETERPLRAEEIRDRVPGYPEADESFHRQFERDKDDLRELGVPVSLEPIPGAEPGAVGYRIHKEDYYLPDPGLAPDELAALHLASLLVRVGEDRGIHALRTLGGMPPVADAPDQPLVDLPGDPNLAPLFAAVVERRTAEFAYRGRHRAVDPYRLEFRRGWWYLVARDRDREEVRNFRLDRVEGAVTLGEAGAFDRPPSPPPGAAVAGWELPEDEPVVAHVVVDAGLAAWAVRQLGEAAVVRRDPDGSVVLGLEVRHRGGFRSFVLGFLDHAEVLDPPELVDEVTGWLRELAS